jgi:hypothetical protein
MVANEIGFEDTITLHFPMEAGLPWSPHTPTGRQAIDECSENGGPSSAAEQEPKNLYR